VGSDVLTGQGKTSYHAKAGVSGWTGTPASGVLGSGVRLSGDAGFEVTTGTTDVSSINADIDDFNRCFNQAVGNSTLEDGSIDWRNAQKEFNGEYRNMLLERLSKTDGDPYDLSQRDRHGADDIPGAIMENFSKNEERENLIEKMYNNSKENMGLKGKSPKPE